MKTATEYIAELDLNAKDGVAALLLGYDGSTTISVYSNDANRLKLLEDAIAVGGIPFGFARIIRGKVDLGLMPEYRDDERLSGVLHEFGKKLEEGSGKAQSESTTLEDIGMNRLVVVLGTTHELQGAEKRGRNVSDPLYESLLKLLLAEDGLDFIFEEATGLGPTTAEKLSLTLGPNRYLDVDPPRDEREKFGIPPNTNEPFMLGSPVSSPPIAGFADRVFHEVHAKREEFWLQQIAKQDFKKAVMICGQNHALSFAFRLRGANFDVKAVTYVPPLPRASPTQSGESKMETIAVNSRVFGEYGKGGRVRVEVDNSEGISAWAKEFRDAREIQNLLLGLAPKETAKIMDFITRTINFGEGHVVISCTEQDFSKYGFEKLPSA